MRFFRLEIPLFIALMVSWVHCQECGQVTLTANSGTFSSPSYPKEYDHELNCTWIIQAPPNHFVRLSFGKNMDLKNPFFRCTKDYVTVNSGTTEVKYCKDSPPMGDLMSDADVMTVHLHTDDFFRNGNGFQATYDIVDKDGNPLDKPEEDDGREDETGKLAETTTSLAKPLTTTTAAPSSPETTTTASPETVKATVTKKPRKPRKGGKKGKKNKKSKEERQREREERKRERRERKLRKQQQRAERRRNKKGKKTRGRKHGKKGEKKKAKRGVPSA